MESLTYYSNILNSLRHQAEELTSAGLSLSSLFEKEATCLNRRGAILCLKTLLTSIRQQLDRVEREEDAIAREYSKSDLALSLGRLAVGSTIKMMSTNRWLTAFSDNLLTSPTDKQRPFGKVLVRIGPKGLPDDVEVVGISRLAREENRQETEAINDLQERGYLLFSEKTFSLLIDKLITEVEKGQLGLPVSAKKLLRIKTSIQASGSVMLKLKKLK